MKENYEAYDEDKIAIKGGVNTKNVTAVLSMLRNSDELEFSVEDSDGDKVYEETMGDVQKTYFNTEAFYTLSLCNILLYNNIFDVLNRMLRNQAVIRLCSRRSFVLFQMEGDFFSDGKKCSYSE